MEESLSQEGPIGPAQLVTVIVQGQGESVWGLGDNGGLTVK